VLGEQLLHLLVLDRNDGHVTQQLGADVVADRITLVNLLLLLLHLLLLLLDIGLETLIHTPKDEKHDAQDKAEAGGRDGDIIWDFHFGGALFLSARNTGCVKRQMLFIFEILASAMPRIVPPSRFPVRHEAARRRMRGDFRRDER